MIKDGRFFIVFKKPDFSVESALSNSDLNGLVDSQNLSKKFNDSIIANTSVIGGTAIDAGPFVLLNLPLSSLQNVLNIQNSIPVHCSFGVGSTIDGAYTAWKVAQRYGKRIEMYVPGKTEHLIKAEIPQDDVMPQMATDEQVNDALISELHAKQLTVNPQDFYGLLGEFQQVLQNFKLNLPTIEMLQLTNPQMYASILDVVMSASNFAQALMQSGVLNPDLGQMLDQQAQAEQQAQMEQEPEGNPEEDESGGEQESEEDSKKKVDVEEPAKNKPSKEFPIGTTKQSGKSYRIRTLNPETGEPEWRYVGRGMIAGASGFPEPGEAGSSGGQEGVAEAQGPQVIEEEL